MAEGYTGVLKISACGPWTMAATIELARSQEPVLADRGAVSDLTASLAEGVTGHVAEVAARVPGARLLLQLDEPALPAVLAGAVPSASGLNRVRAVEPADAEAGLRTVLTAAGAAGAPVLVHCCAPSVPLGMIRDAGAAAAGIDLGQLRPGEEDVLAAAVEAGLGIFAGAVPATPEPVPARSAAPAASPPIAKSAERRSGQQSPGTVAAVRVTELWRRMGWPVARPSGVAASPAASVAGPGGAHPGLRAGWCATGLRPGRAGQLPGSGPDAARTDRGGVPVSAVPCMVFRAARTFEEAP